MVTESKPVVEITGNTVSPRELKKVCSCCGGPLVFGHRNRWKGVDYYWCQKQDCEDHMRPVVVPV